jgi:tetratricopeptide (TPR) repeat protein
MQKYYLIVLIALSGLNLASCQTTIRDPRMLYKSAYEKAHAKLFQAAMADLDKAIALDSNYTEAYLLRGKVRVSLGEKDAACKDARKAADLGSEEGESICEQYCQLLTDEQVAARIKPEDSLSRLYPNRPEPYYNISNIYFDAKQYKRSMEYCDKAILADTTYAPAYYNKGICLLNLHEYTSGCALIYKSAGMGYDMALKAKPNCDAVLKSMH